MTSPAGSRPLAKRFYLRGTAEVARDLLGRLLVSRLPSGEKRAVVIVETEAYLGVSDPACHTFGGRRTERVRPMWGPGGHAYVYRVYGMHSCLNVVTRAQEQPEAVLLRAGVPLGWWRGAAVERAELLSASGPGRLCRRLSIGVELSGAPLWGPALSISAGEACAAPACASGPSFRVVEGPRVGVDYAGEAALWPLRFAVAGCPAVTRRASLRPA